MKCLAYIILLGHSLGGRTWGPLVIGDLEKLEGLVVSEGCTVILTMQLCLPASRELRLQLSAWSSAYVLSSAGSVLLWSPGWSGGRGEVSGPIPRQIREQD